MHTPTHQSPGTDAFERATPWVLGLLGGLFIALTCFVHGDGGLRPVAPRSAAVTRGQAAFRRHYCQACHQVYGLGGYMGPDLTNIYSLRGESHVRAVIISGFRDMPRLPLSLSEMDDLVAYLRFLDASGRYPLNEWPPKGLPN